MKGNRAERKNRAGRNKKLEERGGQTGKKENEERIETKKKEIKNEYERNEERNKRVEQMK